MNKAIDVKLTSISSPICQILIHESVQNELDESEQLLLDSIHFRSVIKGHTLGEYWFSRVLKRHLKNSSYNQFLLAS